jgi:hypothetical protein
MRSARAVIFAIAAQTNGIDKMIFSILRKCQWHIAWEVVHRDSATADKATHTKDKCRAPNGVQIGRSIHPDSHVLG